MLEDQSKPPIHYHNGYDSAEEQLRERNKGAGIFFTVNELDEELDPGRHRTGKMVVGYRATFMDDDVPRDEARDDFPITPSLVVQSSPGKYHYYWLIQEPRSVDKDEWQRVQNGLINRYDGDKQARDLTRYLRLPGFNHMKNPDLPFETEWSGEGEVYTWGEIMDNFPPEEAVVSKADGSVSSAESKPVNQHVQDLIDGKDFHGSLISLTHQMKSDGMADDLVINALKGMMMMCPDEVKGTERWTNRFNDIERDVKNYTPVEREIKVPVVTDRVDDKGDMPWPPGAFGELAQSAYDMARFQYREVAVISALGLVAGICGRKFNAEGAGLNMYATLIMDTGMGKDSINHFITNALMNANDVGTGSSFIGPVRFTGPKAVFNSLKSARSQICVFTEAGLLLSSKSGDKEGLKRVLLGIYTKSGKNSFSGSEIYSEEDKTVKSMRAPALSIINESTPKMLLDVFRTGDALVSGDVPRQLIYRVVGDKPDANRRHYSASLSDSCLEKIKHLVSKCATVQAVEDPSAWDMIPDASVEEDMVATEKFYIKMQNENRHSNTTKYAMATRAYYKAVRLAAIASVFNHYDLAIRDEEWQWAKAMIAFEINGLSDFFQGGGISDPMSDITHRVVVPAVTRILNDRITVKRGLSRKDHKAGKFKKYEITQALKNNAEVNELSDKQGSKMVTGIEKVIDYMIRNDMVFVLPNQRAVVYQVTDTFLAACDEDL
jgi:hypothetical protein